MPAVPKLGVRRCWFSTAWARAALPALHSAHGALILDEETGMTVRVRVVGRAVTIAPAEEHPDATRLSLSAVHSRYWTKTSRGRKVTINTEHSDQFDPTRATRPARVAESPLFDDSDPASQSADDVAAADDVPANDVPAADESADDDVPANDVPADDVPAAADAENESAGDAAAAESATETEDVPGARARTLRALHARLLCLGQAVPGLMVRVASAAFECVGPEGETALGETYLALLRDALRHDAARRLYAEQCAYRLT